MVLVAVAVVLVIVLEQVLMAALVSLSSRFRRLPLAVSALLMAHPHPAQSARPHSQHQAQVMAQALQAVLALRCSRLSVHLTAQARPPQLVQMHRLRLRLFHQPPSPQRLLAALTFTPSASPTLVERLFSPLAAMWITSKLAEAAAAALTLPALAVVAVVVKLSLVLLQQQRPHIRLQSALVMQVLQAAQIQAQAGYLLLLERLRLLRRAVAV